MYKWNLGLDAILWNSISLLSEAKFGKTVDGCQPVRFSIVKIFGEGEKMMIALYLLVSLRC